MVGNRKGSITVFLSLILICIASLMCALLHSARIAGSGWYFQMALNSSVNSLMSKYHRDVWEEYHLLVLEAGRLESLSREVEEYLDEYLREDTVYQLSRGDVEIEQIGFVTDREGEYLEKEILDYMKYGIWTEIGKEDSADSLNELAQVVQAADGIHEVKENYQLNSVQVFQVEKSLEAVSSSLDRQAALLEKGRKALKACRGREFLRTADKLSQEMEKMPSLIKDYEKAAARLEEELNRSESEAEEKREQMGEAAWAALESQMASYRSYTSADGERRREVEETGKKTEANLSIVEEAKIRAEAIQEYIDEWESDDDDDELDEEELWEEVTACLRSCVIPNPGYGKGIADKKRLSVLEKIGKLSGTDLLSFVVPAGTEVSSQSVNLSGLPSGGEKGYKMGIQITEIPDRALINEYTGSHFLCFDAEKGEEKAEPGKPGSRLSYEQEYLLNGASSDRANLRKAVNQLLAVREGMNLIHILGDGQKRSEARTLAAALTGAAAVTPLADVVAFFIMCVWAFAESVEDVRVLLEGGKIPLLKSAEDWQLSLDQMFQFLDREEEVFHTEGEKGLSYRQYLKGFFLVQEKRQRNERIMDVIQLNISGKQKSFQMACCAVWGTARCTAKGTYANLERSCEMGY